MSYWNLKKIATEGFLMFYLYTWVTPLPDLSGNPDFENPKIRNFRILKTYKKVKTSTTISGDFRQVCDL